LLLLQGGLREGADLAAGDDGDPGLGLHLGDGDPLGALGGGDEDGRGADEDAGAGAVLGALGDGGEAHEAGEDGDEDEERRQPAAAQQSDQVFEGQRRPPAGARPAPLSGLYYRPFWAIPS